MTDEIGKIINETNKKIKALESNPITDTLWGKYFQTQEIIKVKAKAFDDITKIQCSLEQQQNWG
jgi:hypothetical protein